MIANMAYALLYEQWLARWAMHATADKSGHVPDVLDLLDQAVN